MVIPRFIPTAFALVSLSLCTLTIGISSAAAAPTLSLPKEVFVKASTAFTITPSLGYQQYGGLLVYDKVTSVRPKNYKFPPAYAKQAKAFMKQARAACINVWVTGKTSTFSQVYPAFIIYDHLTDTQAGLRRLSVQFSPFSMTSDGRWASKGFNSNDPTRRVRAQGGFWDSLYNFYTTSTETTMKFMGKKVTVDCDGNLVAEADYPLVP